MSGYILWGYSLKFRPEKYALYIYMVGISNQLVPEPAIEYGGSTVSRASKG